MKIVFLSKEYPPYVYGGAGVHIDYLSKGLAKLREDVEDITVLCFGDQDEHKDNTWYTLLAGCIAGRRYGVPVIITAHSLEPLRPWKKEQPGRGYEVSKWLEKTAYENAEGIIAVSRSMKRDIQRIYSLPEEKIELIHNGIDSRQYHPKTDPQTPAAYGIDPEKQDAVTLPRE